MAPNGVPDIEAVPAGLIDDLLADVPREVTAIELQRVRRRLAAISVDEPEVLAVIARRVLDASHR